MSVSVARRAPDALPSLPRLEVRGAGVQYGGVSILRGIDLVLDDGEFLAIVGPSGCGKSTLLKLISGLAPMSEGRILWHGRPGAATPGEVGFMFQRDTLLPWATVVENIAVGLDCRGVRKRDQPPRIAALLRLLGLTRFGDFHPRALSGGMRQRVALGRLLAYEPNLYLLDEPFGALDAQTKLQMGYELLNVWSGSRKGVIFVTHDIEEAVSLADRVLVMSRNPGAIKAEYRIDLARPRDLRAIRRLPAFHRLVEDIWNDILADDQMEYPDHAP